MRNFPGEMRKFPRELRNVPGELRNFPAFTFSKASSVTQALASGLAQGQLHTQTKADWREYRIHAVLTSVSLSNLEHPHPPPHFCETWVGVTS